MSSPSRSAEVLPSLKFVLTGRRSILTYRDRSRAAIKRIVAREHFRSTAWCELGQLLASKRPTSMLDSEGTPRRPVVEAHGIPKPYSCLTTVMHLTWMSMRMIARLVKQMVLDGATETEVAEPNPKPRLVQLERVAQSDAVQLASEESQSSASELEADKSLLRCKQRLDSRKRTEQPRSQSSRL